MKRYGDPNAPRWRLPRQAGLFAGVLIAVAMTVAVWSVIRWLGSPTDPRAITGVIGFAVFVLVVAAIAITWTAFWSPLRKAVAAAVAQSSLDHAIVGAWVPSSFRLNPNEKSSTGDNSIRLPSRIVLEFSKEGLALHETKLHDRAFFLVQRSAIISIEVVEFVDGGSALIGVAIATSEHVFIVQPVAFSKFGVRFLGEASIAELVGTFRRLTA